MDIEKWIKNYWRDIAAQDEAAIKAYFDPGASIYWHDTNEQFTVDEFIIANCEYPGDWRGEVERIEQAGSVVITVTRVWLSDNSASFHVTSFFEFRNVQITTLNEYWGEDGVIPQWRLDKQIGKPIK